MTNTTAKLDRFTNRAPKGGAISPVNGQYYAGGQFMPMAVVVVEVKPVPLEGSSRQVAWATRLRRESIDRLTVDIATRRLFLSDANIIDEPGVRRAMRRDSLALHNLMTERSASAVIDRRAATA